MVTLLLKSALAITVLAAPPTLRAGAFGEHKLIGDSALRIVTLPDGVDQLFDKHGSLKLPHKQKFTYGDLCGLAADHTSTSNDLHALLQKHSSKLSYVLQVQHNAMHQGAMSAANSDVLMVDPHYLPLALKNYSHFYNFGDSFSDHLEAVSWAEVEQLCDGADHTLMHTNALAKYAMLHEAARCIAHEAGKARAQEHDDWAAKLLRAIIMNAFADHFLQDAFAPGHVVLRRTVLGSYLTDLNVHDYYNRAGLEFINANGDKWMAYGDDNMSKEAANLGMAVKANSHSLAELFDAFSEGVRNGRLRTVRSTELQELLDHHKALRFVPIPYNSGRDIEQIFPDADQDLLSLNQLDHQGPVVSRLGLAIVGGAAYEMEHEFGGTLSLGIAMRGLGFDKEYVYGGSWYDLGLRFEHDLRSGEQRYLLEVRSVSNVFENWRKFLPADVAIALGILTQGSTEFVCQPSLIISYFSIFGRGHGVIYGLDPKFKFSSQVSTRKEALLSQVRENLRFGLELNLNPVLDAIVSYP